MLAEYLEYGGKGVSHQIADSFSVVLLHFHGAWALTLRMKYSFNKFEGCCNLIAKGNALKFAFQK